MLNQLEPWLQFLERKDNIGLPLMEVKQKYLKEQIEFDDFISQQRSIIRGTANKVEKTFEFEPVYDGLPQYKNFPRCGKNPPIDFFAQNFGDDYVSSINLIGDDLFKINFTEQVLPQVAGNKELRMEIVSPNHFSSPPYDSPLPTLEVIPEFQGREDVLKLTISPGFAKERLILRLNFVIPPSIRRTDYFDNYKWSIGFGMWPVNFDSSGGLDDNDNYNFVGGGNSDFLIFLAAFGDPSLENFGGPTGGWSGDKWNDIRTIERTVIEGNSAVDTWLNFQHLRSLTYPLDPNLNGRGFEMYLSDINFRVCPK